MKTKATIFYSWQSDIKKNKNFIQTCLEKAIKELKKKYSNEIFLEISIDRDTKNKTGSPSIATTIFEKINTSDIFICDVTIINKSKIKLFNARRLTPNPNVLIELGYAANDIGWDRIICINDLNYSNITDLPFDILGHRITTFNSSSSDSREALVKTLTIAIREILLNYDTILLNNKKGKIGKHDYDLLLKINDICNEQTLNESLDSITTNLYTNQFFLDCWDSLRYFYSYSENKFLNKNADELINLFFKKLDSFQSLIIKDFHSKDDDKYFEYLKKKNKGVHMTEEEIKYYKVSRVYYCKKDPYYRETWHECDMRLDNLRKELIKENSDVKKAYKNLILEIRHENL